MLAGKELECVSLNTQIYIKKKVIEIIIFLTDSFGSRISIWSSL